MSTAARSAALRRAALAAAAVLSLFMVARASPGGDQLNLLARGWLLAERGELVPFGNPLSSGGHFPGIAPSLAVGLPLAVWSDPRAPILLLWLLHAGAWLLLDRTLRPALSPLERAALAVVWGLGPMRLEASTVLWNPNYLPPIGVAHLALAAALRRSRPFARSFARSFGPSLALGLLLGIGAQFHPSMLLLGVLTALLWARGEIRPSWPGALAGGALALATLVPALLVAPPSGAERFGSIGYPFRGLLLVAPMLKGLLYWLRSAAIAPSRQSLRLDFGASLGADWDGAATAAILVAALVGAVSTGLVLAANLRLRRAAWQRLTAPRRSDDLRAWLVGYAAWALVAAVLVYAAAPTTPQAWQGLSLLPAACLPVVFAASWLERRLGARRALVALAAAALTALTIDGSMALGGPNYRCTGAHANTFPLRAWSPMFDDLGIHRRCPWPMGVEGAWWPDVLPEEGRAARGRR